MVKRPSPSTAIFCERGELEFWSLFGIFGRERTKIEPLACRRVPIWEVAFQKVNILLFGWRTCTYVVVFWSFFKNRPKWDVHCTVEEVVLGICFLKGRIAFSSVFQRTGDSLDLRLATTLPHLRLLILEDAAAGSSGLFNRWHIQACTRWRPA